MDKVKEFIRENIVLTLIVILLIAIGISYFTIDFIHDHKIYESNVYSGEEVEYITHRYQDNEYKVISMSEEDLFQNYYREYLQMLINDPKSAWEITIQNGENNAYNFNGDYQSFIDYFNQIKTAKTATNTIQKYKIKKDVRYNTINIIDSENQMYEFFEYGIWEFKVAFKGRVNG